MKMLEAWLLFPLVSAVLSLGCGLLVERACGTRVRGALVVPLGLATIVVLARLATVADLTAELATPLVVVAALAGLWLGRGRVRAAAVDRWTLGAALAVFALYAAPVVLSGSATFAGYTVLGDTAVQLAIVDRLAAHGTGLDGLPPSSYSETLRAYFDSGYPVGTHAALGAVRPLAFADVAWVYQPFLAFVAAMLALTLVGLLGGVVRSGWRVAAVAALAAQPALLYAYSLQGSVKELATAWLVPLVAAVVIGVAVTSIRRLLPLAVVVAASVAAIGLAAAVWLGPMLVVALVLVARRVGREPRRVAALAGAFAGLVALLSLPTLLDATDYLDVTRAVVTAQEELGNLAHPLSTLQVAGVWLTGDYRFLPGDGDGVDALELTYTLIGLAAVAGLLGLAWLVRRRALGPLLFAAASLLALWYVTRSGSPWADAKALAIASPAALLLAALGPIALEARGFRVEALALALALAGGVVVSNALAYHDVSLAPRERLEELAHAGELAAGDGPLLYTEFEEFGKHFLRDAQPVGASEAFAVGGLSPDSVDGDRPSFAYPVDIRLLDLDDLSRFRTLVMRRSPYGVRPPAGWRRVWSGRYYELWRNERGAPGLASATCPDPPSLRIADLELPSGWSGTSDAPPLVATSGAGRVSETIEIPRAGRHEVWLSGSFGREVEVRVDGRPAGAVEDELSQPAQWIELDTLALDAGAHEVELIRGAGGARPGDGDGPRRLGQVVLRPVYCS